MANRPGRLIASLRHARTLVPPTRRRLAAVLAAATLAGAGGAAWLAGGQAPAGSGGTLVVTARPLVSRLAVVGTIEPGTTFAIAAPFDGTVKEKLFDYGGRVDKGQVLLVMETGDMEVRLREAQAAALRAGRVAAELKDWNNSPDVARARRALLAAKQALEDTRRKAAETRTLLDRGIVPRLEWEMLDQQIKTLELQHEAAKQDLDSTLEKGSAGHRHIATLELDNARARQSDLERQLEGAAIEAPAAGVILRPVLNASAQAAAAPVEVGSRVTRGQPLFAVAGLERLSVSAKVDEVDVNRLAEGQAVAVTGDAFGATTLDGRITRISAQAIPSAAGHGAAFAIAVEVRPSPEQLRRIRVGMSSTLTITLYENPHALVVPPDALRPGEDGPTVLVLDSGQTQPRQARVTVGQAVEDGIEILDGLHENDCIVVR